MNEKQQNETVPSTSATTSHLRALAHPVRLQMLSLLTGAELSAAELARELDLTHANASYHLRVLLKSGEVEIASEEKIRGGLARSYRPRLPSDSACDPDQGAHGVTTSRPHDQALFVRALTDRLIARNAQRSKTRAMYVDAELWIEPAITDQVDALLSQASALMHTNAQPPHSPECERRNLSIAWFEMQPGTGGQDSE